MALTSSRKDEIIASRYNIEINAGDLKRIQSGNFFNTKLVDFYVNYLNEKLRQKSSHVQSVALPSLFFNPINSKPESAEAGSNYQETIELLIKKANEIKKGEPNIFKLTERMFFVTSITNSQWVIVEVQRGAGMNKSPGLNVDYEALGIKESFLLLDYIS